MAFIGREDPLLTTVSQVIENGDLLSYLDDASLLTQLGINPSTAQEVGEDVCNAKLLDSEAKNYVTLLPPTPDQDPAVGSIIDTEDVQCDTTLMGGTPYGCGVSSLRNSTVDNAFRSTTAVELATEPITNRITFNAPTTVQVTGQPMYIISTKSIMQEHQTNNTESSYFGSPLASPAPSPVALSTSSVALSPCPDVLSPSSVVFSPSPATPSPSSSTYPAASPVATTINKMQNEAKQLEQKQSPSTTESSSKTPASKSKPQRRRRPRKPKKYEICETLDDPCMEKRRLNAINAKKNRDRKKDMMKKLEEKVAHVTRERDLLKQEVNDLQEREKYLREQLHLRFGVQQIV